VTGTKTYDEILTVVKVDLATGNVKLDGIVHGMFVNSITANPDDNVMTWCVGKVETTDNGTMIGFYHDDGTVTSDGTVK
jgi:hypothetical protein